MAGRLDEVGYLLDDLAGDLASYLASLDADPARLEWIAGRLAELVALTRKYGPGVDAVLAWPSGPPRTLPAGSDDRIAELDAASPARTPSWPTWAAPWGAAARGRVRPGRPGGGRTGCSARRGRDWCST